MTKWEEDLGLTEGGPNSIYKQTNAQTSLLSQYPDLYKPIPLPELPSYPTPSLMDENRVSQLTQQFASPAIRAGRSGLRDVLSRGSRENPIQQQYRARGAIAGLGDVINSGISAARSPAISIASGEAATANEANKVQYESAWKKALMKYEEDRRIQQLQLQQRSSEQSYQRQRLDNAEKKASLGGGVSVDSGSYDRAKAASDAEWKRLQEMDTSPVDPYTMKPYSRTPSQNIQSGYKETPYQYSSYSPSQSDYNWSDSGDTGSTGSLTSAGMEYYNNSKRGYNYQQSNIPSLNNFETGNFYLPDISNYYGLSSSNYPEPSYLH